MRNALLVGLGLFLTACSGSTATVDPVGSGSSSSSGGTSSSGGVVSTPSTPPDSSFQGSASGCRDVTVYKSNADRTQFLVVNADREKLGLAVDTIRTFDLAHMPDGLEVGVDVFARAPGEAPYCSDAPDPTLSKTAWAAEGGTITIQLEAVASTSGAYLATVRLTDVRLVGPERGVAVSVPNAEIRNVLVGWLPG
jgi:hypothetical protein